MHHITQATAKSTGTLTVAMVAGMPYPMAKASCIRVGHLVDNLAGQFDDVRVKVFAYEGTGNPASHPHVEYHLVGGFDSQKAKYYTWSNKLRADARLIRAMIRQRKAIDLIHCHTIEGLGIALAFKALTLSRAPICMDVHGPVVAELVHYRLIPSWRPIVAAVNGLESAMLSFVGHAFVSNDGLKNLLLQRLPSDRVTTVFDYVDLEHFDSGGLDHERLKELRARHKSDGGRVIAYAGMFKDYQGVDFLIRAFADLSARHPDLRLILIGDGPCRGEYEQLIGQLGIQERVHLPGLVPHSDVVNWLEIADVVVSPRIDNEITRAGFVSQLPEYMAAGKTIVATAVSGCSFLLRDGAGILVAPNDVGALAQGIETALDHDPAAKQVMVQKARQNVAQFTWKEGIGAVYRVYRSFPLAHGR
jgi:glycosyltransferase involved in cell wall biosynthesis